MTRGGRVAVFAVPTQLVHGSRPLLCSVRQGAHDHAPTHKHDCSHRTMSSTHCHDRWDRSSSSTLITWITGYSLRSARRITGRYVTRPTTLAPVAAEGR